MQCWFHRVVLSRRWATFVVLGLSFLVFGVGTLSPFMLVQANVALVFDNGWQALRGGGAAELFELLVTGYVSLVAYVVFKACEVSPVQRVLRIEPVAEPDRG